MATTKAAPIAAATNAPKTNGMILFAETPCTEAPAPLVAPPLSKLLDSHPSFFHPSAPHASAPASQQLLFSSQLSSLEQLTAELLAPLLLLLLLLLLLPLLLLLLLPLLPLLLLLLLLLPPPPLLLLLPLEPEELLPPLFL